MTTDQIILFTILGLVFVFLIWGRWRYDLVAFSALIVAVLTGVVPTDQAFSGFGHPATVVIALVLIVSRGLSNAGVVEMIAGWVASGGRSLSGHIGLMSGVAAGLSAVMNNVAALALLMPVDIQTAKSAKRSPALSLMPLSFASILGGLVTLIGTPPNIVIAAYRGETLGTPFGMFDFTPVGIVCAVVGVIFVALVGWRLVPRNRTQHDSGAELFALEDYVVELKVPEDSEIVGKRLKDLDTAAEEHEVQFLGLIRGSRRLPGNARYNTIAADDILVMQAGPDAIEKVAGKLGCSLVDEKLDAGALKGDELEMTEVVVPQGAAIEGRSFLGFDLLSRSGVHLMGISRQGEQFQSRVRHIPVQSGDILLLLGPGEVLSSYTQRLGALPLASRNIQMIQRDKAGLAVGLFVAAIALASFGLVYLAAALAAVVALYVLLKIVPVREVYDSVEWPVIVLLGSMIPIGQALEVSGGTTLIAAGIVDVSAGAAAWVVLTLLMIVTMTLSDVMNNTATAVITAPIAVDIAHRLNVSPDPFLMAVAVAASCAFLTPIGHKNNTLIMGPGGYRFGDYWRMGLPLEILVIAVAIPMILLVFPF